MNLFWGDLFVSELNAVWASDWASWTTFDRALKGAVKRKKETRDKLMVHKIVRFIKWIARVSSVAIADLGEC